MTTIHTVISVKDYSYNGCMIMTPSSIYWIDAYNSNACTKKFSLPVNLKPMMFEVCGQKYLYY